MFSYKHIIMQNTMYFTHIHIYVIYVLHTHTHNPYRRRKLRTSKMILGITTVRAAEKWPYGFMPATDRKIIIFPRFY